MNISSIDKFNICAAKVFENLYSQFPLKVNIEITNFPEYDTKEDNGLFYGTVDFLKDEGFINYSDKVYGGYINLVLTAKGFTVLNSPASIISSEKTIGEEIKNQLNVGKDESIKLMVREIFKLFVSYF